MERALDLDLLIDGIKIPETAASVIYNLSLRLFTDALRLSDENHRGGYLHVTHEGNQLLTVKLGNIKKEKHGKYFELCHEKADRLLNHREHVLASQSRNPDKEEWGGAVKFGKYVISFSGFLDSNDEIYVIEIARLLTTYYKETFPADDVDFDGLRRLSQSHILGEG